MSQSAPSLPSVAERETRVEALLCELRPQVEVALRRMVEKWVDTPEHEEFGAIEYELRDAGLALAQSVQQTGLASRKKRAT